MEELLASELSADTLAALQAHLVEQQVSEDAEVSEDFRLSQLYVHGRLQRDKWSPFWHC